ncbi:MAG: TDP-4-oxo-6-deoxy-D-glucose transaminase [Francisellaceae bacterium]|nr:TDP-4-oxo-6-deoxy-D-glucose transaminase [Francisellaceae bacterium]
MDIPFNLPYITGNEKLYIDEVLKNKHFSGDGIFTQKCQHWLENYLPCKKALLTPSCTAALEMAAILINIEPGDEIIMPSFTFVSTAMAFLSRGGIPVFVDINKITLNIDENKIETAITAKTKAIVVVHYGGVSCEMDRIMSLAAQHQLFVIEDAAQALMSDYKGKRLGSIGHLSTFSFHATKNIIAGEGGALCINDDRFIERAEIIREKGTNRKKFIEGAVDKYSWVDIGSSYLCNEITAAFLYAQLEEALTITEKRLLIWNKYFEELSPLSNNLIYNPLIPKNFKHNAHLYYLIFSEFNIKNKIIHFCKNKGISLVTHYVPLHSSLVGKKYCRVHGDLKITNQISSCLLRLPLWIGIEKDQQFIIQYIQEAIKKFT